MARRTGVLIDIVYRVHGEPNGGLSAGAATSTWASVASLPPDSLVPVEEVVATPASAMATRRRGHGWGGDMADFLGRTVLVTGATGGIGGATVRRLVDAGADVVAGGRSVDAL